MLNLVKRPYRKIDKMSSFRLIDYVGLSLVFSLILLSLIFLLFDIQFIR